MDAQTETADIGGNMAEAGRSWYTELDFDSYVLDLILLGWCTLCISVMLAVNAIASALGPLKKKAQDKEVEFSSSETSNKQLPIETCQWFNNALNWFYLHYYYNAPDFVNEWVQSLNTELVKLGGPVPAKIEQIQTGSLPPKVTHVSCEASPNDRFILHVTLESRDLAFQLFASQQTQQGVKLTNCTANVLRLKGTLRVESFREGADVKVKVSFEKGKPEIKVLVKPNNLYQNESELVDLGVLESNIRHAISLAQTVFPVTHLLMPGDLHTAGHDRQLDGYAGILGHGSSLRRGVPSSSSVKSSPPPLATSTPVPASTPTASLPSPSSLLQPQQTSPEETTELIEDMVMTATAVPEQQAAPPAKHQPSQSYPPVLPLQTLHQEVKQPQQQHLPQQHLPQQLQPSVNRRDQQRVRPQSRPEGVFEPVEVAHLQSTLPVPPKPPRMSGDKRLLVKVIKANGLTLQEVGPSSVVCMVSTDEPVQGYGTSFVRNTCHPFWDEHFLFDVTQDTQEVHVEVYDTSKAPGDDFVGESIVYVEELRKNPSSRQILRLHPDPHRQEYNAGSVTAEFLFMDPSEADLLQDSMLQQVQAQLSPRRRIEIERTAAPGGTLVTMTTTTERSPYGRHDPGVDGSPNYIEKNVDDSVRFSYNDSSSNVSSETIPANGVASSSIPVTALREIQNRSRLGKSKSGTVTITAVRRTVEGPPEDDLDTSRPSAGQEKDDLELVKRKQESPASPNLKKSRTLGGSLKKLFRRGRKRSQGRGDNSRDSSLSRNSHRASGSKGASRDSSLSRPSNQRGYERASSVS